VAEVRGHEAGLVLLDEIEPGSVLMYQPYWAVRAHLLKQLNRGHTASTAFDCAIRLSEDEAVRRFLQGQRGEAGK
jgi:RNA polymerase sigma-70 factor (ECF subfamily)